MKVLGLHYRYWLIAIFLAALAFRLFFVFQTPYFDQDSYFAVRQVDSILDNGSPVFKDDLSFGGKHNIFFPTFYYVLAGFSLILGKYLALKILPSVFIVLFVPVAFLLGKKLTGDLRVALLVAFFAGFTPSFFIGSFNSVSPLSLFLPLMFFALYLFISAKKEEGVYSYVAVALLMSVLSPLSFIFVFGLLIYLILVKLEYRHHNKKDLELSLFSIFFVLWVLVLSFKKVFLFHGFSVVWQNMPSVISSGMFREVELINIISSVGFITLFFGIFTVYKYILKERDREIYLMVAFAISISILLWLRLVELDKGLVFLGAVLVILSSRSVKLFFDYLEKTKVSGLKTLLWVVVLLLFILPSVFSSIGRASETIRSTPTYEEMSAFEWVATNTGEDSVVLAPVSEGFLVTAVGKRSNVADMDFLLVNDPEVIIEDMATIYSTKFNTRAIELIDRYSIDFIIVSDAVKEEFGVDDLAVGGTRCFPEVYGDGVKIYQVRCHVQNE